MKLLRAIRLDASDTFVFERAAEPGEIVTPGSFVFWEEDVATLGGKRRSAFRAGFVGVASGGFSTLAQVCAAEPADIDAAMETLARLLVREHGAPDIASALPAAREEIEAAMALADHAPDTLIAMRRFLDEQGEIREQFRTLHRRADGDRSADPRHDRAFTFFEVEDETSATEQVDFATLMKDRNA